MRQHSLTRRIVVSRFWLAGTVLLLAFLLRAYHLDFQSLWRDEVDALRFAYLPPSELLQTFVRSGWNGPLYYPLLRVWISVAGQTEFALRFLSLLGGTLVVPLVYAMGGMLGARRLAVLGGLLSAVSPYLVWYSQEAKMYALLTAAALLSWYLYLRAVREHAWPTWVGYVLITSLCMYLHLLAVIIIPVQAVVFLLRWGEWSQVRRDWLTAMTALVLPYLPFARWEIPLLFSGFRTGHLHYPLNEVLAILIQAFSLGVVPRPTVRLLLPFPNGTDLFVYEGLVVPLFLSVAGLILCRRRRSLQLVLCWLLLPPMALYLISLRIPVFTVRYLVWIAPAYVYLLGMGLLAVREQSKWVFVLCLSVLLVSSAQSLYAQSHVPIKSDFRQAAFHVRARRLPGEPVLFLIPHVRHTFEYYYGPAEPWVDGPSTNGDLTPAALDRLLEEEFGDAVSVWLVSSEPELWDRSGLVEQWLESHGRRTDGADFVRVSVARYMMQE